MRWSVQRLKAGEHGGTQLGPAPRGRYADDEPNWSPHDPIDAAMAHASLSIAPEITPMSLELKVSYFAPARPGLVVAEGWIERRGRTTCFAEGRLLDGEGRVLARGSSTIRLIPRDVVEAGARDAADRRP